MTTPSIEQPFLTEIKTEPPPEPVENYTDPPLLPLSTASHIKIEGGENATVWADGNVIISAERSVSVASTRTPQLQVKQEPTDVSENTYQVHNNAASNGVVVRNPTLTCPTIVNKKYNCRASGCPFKTDDFHSFKGHRVYHQVYHKFKGHLKCSYCSFCCNTQTTLTWHLFQHIDAQNSCQPETSHTTKPSSFLCQYCSVKCDSRRELSLHLKQHKKNIEMRGKLDRTRRKDWQSKLKKYVVSCLKRPNRKTNYYQCPECPFKARIKNRLWFVIHFIQHMSMAGQECPLCTYKSTIEGIKSHLLVHVRKKPMLKCCSCHCRFRTNATLLRHIRGEHSLGLRDLKVLLIRNQFTKDDKTKEVVLPECGNITNLVEVSKPMISPPIEDVQIRLCMRGKDCTNIVSINGVVHANLEAEVEQLEQVLEPTVSQTVLTQDNDNISSGHELARFGNIVTECSESMSLKPSDQPPDQLDSDDGDTITAVIFESGYYDSPDDLSLAELIRIHAPENITNLNLSGCETAPLSSCFILETDEKEIEALENRPISEEEPSEIAETQLVSSDRILNIDQQEQGHSSCTEELPCDRPSRITITITTTNGNNGESAELIKSSVMAELLKSLEFSNKLTDFGAINNDENDNLETGSLEKAAIVTEMCGNKKCEPVSQICEQTLMEVGTSIFNGSVTDMDFNGSFSGILSADSEKSLDDENSNQELSDVPKETDLLFKEIISSNVRRSTENASSDDIRLTESFLDEDLILNDISMLESQFPESLEVPFCPERLANIEPPTAKESETYAHLNHVQCDSRTSSNEFEIESTTGTDKVCASESIITTHQYEKDSTTFAHEKDLLEPFKTRRLIEESCSNESPVEKYSWKAPDVQVSKLSDVFIVYNYNKEVPSESTSSLAKPATPFNNKNTAFYTAESSEFKVNGVQNYKSQLDIEDMDVVFDIPVDRSSGKVPEYLQDSQNADAIEFYVVPSGDESDDSFQLRESSPKAVAFEEVSNVPDVLELIGATCEISGNREEGLMEDGLPEEYEQAPNPCSRSDFSDLDLQRTDESTPLPIQNGIPETSDEFFSNRIEVQFSCEHCPSEFTKRSHLAMHIQLHQSDKGVKCRFCSYRANKTLLLRHMLVHVDMIDAVYKCPLCGVIKRNKVFLHDHLKVDHSRAIFSEHDSLCKKRNRTLCNGCC